MSSSVLSSSTDRTAEPLASPVVVELSSAERAAVAAESAAAYEKYVRGSASVKDQVGKSSLPGG